MIQIEQYHTHQHRNNQDIPQKGQGSEMFRTIEGILLL